MTTRRLSRIVVACVVTLATVTLTVHLSAQRRQPRVGLPDDWSHQHLVFSGPGTYADMLAPGASQERWLNWLTTQADARHDLQQRKRVARHTVDANGLAAARAAFGDNRESRDDDGEGRERPGSERHSSASGWSVKLSNAVSASAPTPAKYTFDIYAPPSCTDDFVVFGVNAAGGSAHQANIVGFNNLYSGSHPTGICGSAPTVRFAYRVGNGTVPTSPVLSIDGTKVAFIENAGASVLHVLTVGTTGTNGNSYHSPKVPGAAGGNNAVDAKVTLDGGVAVSLSAPFVDYLNDVAYVGDDSGRLHKIVDVFLGSPSEVTTGGWPVAVGAATNLLTPPVLYDGNLYVGASDAHLYCIVEATTAPCATPTLAVGVAPLTDAPAIDGSTSKILMAGQSAIGPILVQATSTFTSVVTVGLGAQPTTAPVHVGVLDSAYFNNPFNGTSTAGATYLCGTAPAGEAGSFLYRVGFDANGTLNAAASNNLRLTRNNSGPASGGCQSLAAIDNPNLAGGAKERLFAGVAIDGDRLSFSCGSGRTHGCLWTFDITSAFPTAPIAAYATPGTRGVGPVVVDNVSSAAQASNVYFVNLDTGMAVKASQRRLE